MARKSVFKRRKYAWNPRNEFLYSLMASKVGVVCINWLFQGILGMDRTDRWFKLCFDGLVTGGLMALLWPLASFWIAFFSSVFLAHTLNWLLNGHLFALGGYVGFTNTLADELWSYSAGIQYRTQGKTFLLGVLVFGSAVREEGVRVTSDMDMRFIRRSGFWNGVRAARFSMLERSRALIARFPLDLYLFDSLSSLNRLRDDERPIILYDPEGVLQAKYAERGYEWLEQYVESLP